MRVKHVERHIGEQMIIIDTFSQFFEKFLRVGHNNITPQRAETRLEALSEEWERFRTNNIAIRIAVKQLPPKDRQLMELTSYLKHNLYSVTHDHYLEIVEKLKSFLDTSHENTTSMPTLANQVLTTASPSQLPTRTYQDPRLPRLHLPTFSGNHDEWLTFKDSFSTIVVGNPFISTFEKHQYLKSCLQGTAAQLFKTTSTGEEDFFQAWEAVKSFYDSRKILLSATLDSLFNIKEIKEENAKELERLYTSSTQIYRTLQNLKRPVEHWDDILVHIIVRQKLDSRSIRSWEQYVGSSDEPPTWDKLQTFLISRSRTLRAIKNSQVKRSSSSSHLKKSVFKGHYASQAQENYNLMSESPCVLCKGSHYIGKCPEYTLKTTKQRNELINKLNLCYNCLRAHKIAACRSVFRCIKCGKTHHSSLHQNETTRGYHTSSTPAPKQDNIVLHSQPSPGRTPTILLATARLRVINEHGDAIVALAILDQGSEITLVSQNLVQRLQITRKLASIPIVGIGAHKVEKTKGIVSLALKPHFNSSYVIHVEAHILPRLTSLSPSVPIVKSKWPHLEGLHLANPNFAEPGKIDLILGADIYGQLLDGPLVKGPMNTPTAQQTKLGWIISGPSQSVAENHGVYILHCSIDYNLSSLLEQFWLQEEIATRSQVLTIKDEKCENHFQKTHQRDNTGRYVVRLPFKESTNQIGDSKPSALRMLHQIHHRFEKDPSLFTAYAEFLKEYEHLHHMNHNQETSRDAQPAFYLPHHGVIRAHSSTTKIRVVFNGSCKVKDGIPLNEALHTGPKCQINLFDVLLWMRTFQYIFSADIEKMYRQILVHPDDRRYQRILWKKDDMIIEYELATVTYGLACAPFLVLRLILQLLKDDGPKYPNAVEIMLKGRYVDDIFGGADSPEIARQYAKELDNLCMAGGFPLKKWISNHPEILNDVHPDYKLNTDTIPIKDQSFRALGLNWNPSSDVLWINLTTMQCSPVTKRSVLSKIAQFFDPFGLLSPLFIKSKIFMQELWLTKLQWDDVLPAAQQHTWNNLVTSLSGLEAIKIPRWLGTTSKGTIEIHGFSDSSQSAMAAVVYVKTFINNTTQTTILCSKTKVTPLKRMTIPRLELSAAVLLTKLTHHCIKVLNLLDMPCFLWTDSSIVHTWINNHPSKWKEFIHNRTCLIHELLPNAQWRHVPGIENAADCATRGLSSKELHNHVLWWKGPTWLALPMSSWPENPTSMTRPASQDLEERPLPLATVLQVRQQPIEWDLLHRYSSLNRLLKITVRCLRVFKEKSFRAFLKPVTPEDILNARTYWIKKVQQQHLSAEIKILKENKDFQKSSKIVRLFPFLDEQGLLRVGGRLRNSLLPHNAKHPYILPQQSALSTLIIEDAHRRTLHGTLQETLFCIRQSCWILGGRRPVRSFILKCVKCTRYRRQHAQHIMGQLPTRRVIPSRAFLHSGVDYAGPLHHLASSIAEDGTKWHFNPPSSPHFGGKWEAGVKLMKHHLRRAKGDTLLTYEELLSVVTQVESILNSRPLCKLTDDPDDIDVLTPGHFLIGQPLNLIPEPSVLQIQSSRLSRWQLLCQMTQSFWRKWSKAYLQQLQDVYKWLKPTPSLHKGSIVLIMDDRYPPSKWPLGKIVELHHGADGVARVAQVKTSVSIITRPVVKLCPLDVNPVETHSSPESTKAAGKC